MAPPSPAGILFASGRLVLHAVRRFASGGAAAAFLVSLIPSAASADPPGKRFEPLAVARICRLIEVNAETHDLPKDFFARLIWKESRFDPDAVSPAGAEGIAQFMPGTAKMRGWPTASTSTKPSPPPPATSPN